MPVPAPAFRRHGAAPRRAHRHGCRGPVRGRSGRPPAPPPARGRGNGASAPERGAMSATETPSGAAVARRRRPRPRPRAATASATLTIGRFARQRLRAAQHRDGEPGVTLDGGHQFALRASAPRRWPRECAHRPARERARPRSPRSRPAAWVSPLRPSSDVAGATTSGGRERARPGERCSWPAAARCAKYSGRHRSDCAFLQHPVWIGPRAEGLDVDGAIAGDGHGTRLAGGDDPAERRGSPARPARRGNRRHPSARGERERSVPPPRSIESSLSIRSPRTGWLLTSSHSSEESRRVASTTVSVKAIIPTSRTRTATSSSARVAKHRGSAHGRAGTPAGPPAASTRRRPARGLSAPPPAKLPPTPPGPGQARFVAPD